MTWKQTIPLSILAAICTSAPIVATIFSIDSHEVDIHLNEPIMEGGKLSTGLGGKLSIPKLNLYLQARHIEYFEEPDPKDGILKKKVKAQGQVIFYHKDQFFTAESMDYDFSDRTGTLYNAKTVFNSWFINGETVRIYSDSSFEIENSEIRITPYKNSVWKFSAQKVIIDSKNRAHLHQVSGSVLGSKIFSMGKSEIDLKQGIHFPLEVKVKIGSSSNSGMRLRYRIPQMGNLKPSLYGDYLFRMGYGLGLDLDYRISNWKMHMQNYIARGKTEDNKKAHTRYRFAGNARYRSEDRKSKIEVQYDRLSDNKIPSNFSLDRLQEVYPYRTQIYAHHREDSWQTSALLRVKANPFEEVKQETPTLRWNAKTLEIGNTGILTDNYVTASFLDYRYPKEYLHNPALQCQNYHSARLILDNRFYRPLSLGVAQFTPHVGFKGFAYSNNPVNKQRNQAIFVTGFDWHTMLHREYGSTYKHTLEPYVQYRYESRPQIKASQGYIFDIQDSLYEINQFRFGFQNHFYDSSRKGNPLVFSADVYAYSFHQYSKIKKKVPAIYLDLQWLALENVRYSLNAAWNTKHNKLNHCNLGMSYTYDEDLAFGLEFRHRSKYDWRKLDRSNFNIDHLYAEETLLNTLFSGVRDTFLAKACYRLAPDCTLKLSTQHGWKRKNEPQYYAYTAQLETQLESQLKLKFMVQHSRKEKFSCSIGIEH